MEIETIGIAVDTSGLDKGTAALKRTEEAAKSTSEAADKLETKLGDVGYGAGVMGGALALAFSAAVTGAIAAGLALDKLIGKVAKYQDLAEKTGGDPAGIASMRTAADVAGTSVEAVAMAMGRMNRIMASTDDESKGAGRALAALGINLQDIKNLKGDEQLRLIAKALAEFSDAGGGKSAILQALTGRGGGEMLVFMKELADDVNNVTYHTREGIKAADDYSDANARVISQISQMAEMVAMKALPPLAAFAKAFIDTATEALGMGNGLDDLRKNTSIEAFVTGGVKFLAFLIDALDSVLRPIQFIHRAFMGLAQSINEMKSGGTFASANEVLKKAEADMLKIANRPYLGQNLNKELANIKANGEATAAAIKAEGDKKVIVFKATADKVAKVKKDTAEKADPADAVIRGISGRIAEMRLELDLGEKITAGQRMAAKIMDDVRTGTLKLTAAKAVQISQMLEEMLIAEKDIVIKKQQADAQRANDDERQDGRDALAAYERAEQDAINAANIAMRESQRATEATNAATKFEIGLMDVSASKREKLLEQYRIEIAYRERLREIENGKLPASAQADLKRGAELNRDTALKGASANELLGAMKELDSYFDPTKAQSFGEALRDSFGQAGNAIGQMTVVIETFGRKQAEINKLREAAVVIEKAAGDAFASGDVLDGIELQSRATKANAKIERESSKSRITAYGDMAGAMKNFFQEGTTGYKALEVVQAAFQVVQAASNLAMGLSAAAVGVATQAQGDPYTAWARMAAMAASMASLGFAVKGMGGFAAGSTIAKDRQAAAGAGSVLGDSSEKSESIARSLDMIESSSEAGMKYQSGMLTSLRNIESSLGGLAGIVVRTAGLASGYSGSTQFGTTNVKDPFMFGPLSFLNKTGIFGKSKTSLADQGVTFTPQQLNDILQNGIQGQTYTDIETQTKSFFGLRKKTSMRRETGDLSQEVEDQFSKVIKNIVDTTRFATGALGQSAAEYTRLMQDVTISLGTLSFKGLTGKQIEEQLTNVFSKVGDDIARVALPSIEEFQKIGEGLFETVVRVSSGVESANEALAKLNISAVNYTKIANKQGDVGAEIFRQSIAAQEALKNMGNVIPAFLAGVTGGVNDLVDAYKELVSVRNAMTAVGANFWNPEPLVRGAGGMDELQSGLQSYFENFFTDAEQNAARINQLNRDLASMGQGPIEFTVQAFRARLSSIDLSTNAGQEQFGRLIAMSEQFYEVAAAQAAAVRETTDALQSSIQGFLDYAKALRTFQTDLLLGSQSTASLTEKTALARSNFEQTVNNARGGDADAQKGVIGSASSFLDALKNSASSSLEYEIGFAAVQATIDAEAKRADSLATQQIDVLRSIDATLAAIYNVANPLVPLPEKPLPSFSLRGEDDRAYIRTQAELLTTMQSLRDEVVGLRAETQATAVHTHATSKATRQLVDFQIQPPV